MVQNGSKSFVNNLSSNDVPYSKVFMKFGWPELPQNMIDFYVFSLVAEASDPDRKGPPL